MIVRPKPRAWTLLFALRGSILPRVAPQVLGVAAVSAMSGTQAACERIRATPLPFAYTLLLHRTAYLFCASVPFGLASSLGWATPALAGVIAYTFSGLDALGSELEEPFGRRPNGLPLDAMVRTIEIDLLPAAGEAAPPPLRAERFVLS